MINSAYMYNSAIMYYICVINSSQELSLNSFDILHVPYRSVSHMCMKKLDAENYFLTK